MWAALAPWRSGYAAACKAVYTGSIPVGASSGLAARVSTAWTRVRSLRRIGCPKAALSSSARCQELASPRVHLLVWNRRPSQVAFRGVARDRRGVHPIAGAGASRQAAGSRRLLLGADEGSAPARVRTTAAPVRRRLRQVVSAPHHAVPAPWPLGGARRGPRDRSRRRQAARAADASPPRCRPHRLQRAPC